MKYAIGIDIGGTNTDAVLIDKQEKIVAFAKVNTTEDIATGFERVLKALLSSAGVLSDTIESIVVGTTHATNAILQHKELYKVGVIRLAGQYPESPPPCFGWPQGLSEAVLTGYATVAGGFECHGAPIRPLDVNELRDKVTELLDRGVESIALIGVFSPLNAEQEIAAAEIVKEIAGAHFPITLSHKISGVGFLERENSAILNAALQKVMKKGFHKLQNICAKLGLTCPLFVTQNNGSRIGLEEAVEHPILTISAGPTNSFVGASKLCCVQDAIIIDIGGTSTDIGLIKQGGFRRSLNTSNIGGVKLNFPMPDVVSLAIGGGSRIKRSPLKIGPSSVGREIASQAMSFGGSELTLTDLALVVGEIQIDGADPKKALLSEEEAMLILQKVVETIEEHLLLIAAEGKNLPIILVGGGAALLPSSLLHRRYVVPPHASVANAYGAALSGISGSVDTVVSLTDQARSLGELKEKAMDAALQKGAALETIQIADVQIIPYHYVPNNMARVIVTAHGRGS